MKFKSLISDIIAIIVGILCIICKSDVIKIVATTLGIIQIAYGIILIIYFKSRNKEIEGIIRILIGVSVLILGWTLIAIVIYVIAGLFIFYGIYNIVLLIKQHIKNFKFYINPIVQVVVGALLLFNMVGTMDWIFIINGIILIVNGVVDILLNDYLGRKNK